jgi:GT2 family glycosyltransferase
MSTIDKNIPVELDWLLGSTLFITRSILNEVGMFDEGYKLYFEDVDLCYRIKQKGYRVLYYPGAQIIHDHQRESAKGLSKKTLWHIQSGIRFFNKFGWRF